MTLSIATSTVPGDRTAKLSALRPFHDLEGLEGSLRELAFDRLERKFDLIQALGTNRLLLCA